MKRWHIATLVIAASLVSAGVGFWFGFREALPLGVAADFMPRGTIAARHLAALRAGNTQNLATSLEFEVDNGLIWGHDVLNHPLRHLWNPLWGWNVYPEFEQYAVRLANYRKDHPSLMKADAFDKAPADRPDLVEAYKDLALGARETTAKLNLMIERYATKR
jgi:hypothetical protein